MRRSILIGVPCAMFLMAHALFVLRQPGPAPLYAQAPASDIVLHPGRAATVAGAWRVVNDAAAADGVAVHHPNGGAAKITRALVSPVNFFEMSFDAEAGVPYRLWMRGRADGNGWANDSVFVQFSASVSADGTSVFRTGTTSALEVNLEDCSGCGLSGWGWQDTGWGVGVLGPEVRFASSGTQRMRVQTREDGFRIDQIVLSPQRYLTAAPGSLKNDATIVSPEGTPPAVTLVRRPYLQQVTASSALVVWATREAGAAELRVATGSGTRTIGGSSRLVPASRTGLGFDYHHHEAAVGSLAAGTEYDYEVFVGGTSAASASFRTAPATGTGPVSFVAFGDSGTGSAAQRQLATRMASAAFDLALLTGDIAYGSASGGGDASFRTYQDWFFDIYAAWLPFRPVFTVTGNHDSRPTNGHGVAYLDLFSLPRNGGSAAYPEHAERYYSFDYGPVHFVALDTEFTFQDATRRAEQLSWLEADLAATRQPWKVAVLHRSPYSAGGEHGSDLAVRAAFGPILEQYGVQLVLSSHEHDYERTHPLRDAATAFPVTYVVTGGGGAPLYAAATAEWTAFSASRHHYVHGDVRDCTLTLRAIGVDGAAFDTAVIERCTPGPAPPPADPGDVVLYASEAARTGTRWIVEPDASAAGGARLANPDAGAARPSAPAAQPASYAELTFEAQAGTPYRLWLRSRGARDHWSNDSVFVQFDRSVTAGGAAQFRIGTTSGATVNLEDCSGCGIRSWGWQDNGYGAGVMGPLIYFQASGTQRLRLQQREDGIAIDQIVLSPVRYLNSAPGALENDSTIVSRP